MTNKRTDWNRIERLYRAGLLAVTEIARECHVLESNIRYHAKKHGWKRDLTDDMRSRTRTKMVENLAKVFDSGEALDKLKQEESCDLSEEIVIALRNSYIMKEHL